MHIDAGVWLRLERDASLRATREVIEPDSTKAEFTAYVAKAKHPKDHHEFAARLVLTGVYGGNIPGPVRIELQHALDGYLAEHPNGLDNSEVTV